MRFIFVFLLMFLCYCDGSNIGTMQIKDFVLTPCPGTERDPIKVSNVTVEFGNHLDPIVSGVFSTDVDLISPIRVSIDVKRKVVFWIEVPCIDNVGSCTYEDVCTFGKPDNATCPEILNKNKVPCRCPIKKGTYVIPESFGRSLGNTAIYTGSYKGYVHIENTRMRLACFNMSFELYNA